MQHTRRWSKQARPFPQHIKWVTHFDPDKYDFALLHIDQQCIDESIALGKATLFKEIKSVVQGKVPIIVINHATPVYPEVLTQLAMKDGYKPTEESGEAWAVEKMKEALEGVGAVVVNSYKAQEMWGFGKTIIHGLDTEDWKVLKKEPRVATFIAPAGMGMKYYGRRLFHDTCQLLEEKYGIRLLWMAQDVKFKDWKDYKTFMAKTLVYFNPTLGSPMPRTRTEAMFSGCCVVTTHHQDADKFFKDGVNGFLIKNNPEQAAKVIAERMDDYKGSVEIGKKAREDAIKMFGGDRFRNEWIDLVGDVLNKDLSYLKGCKNDPEKTREEQIWIKN